MKGYFKIKRLAYRHEAHLNAGHENAPLLAFALHSLEKGKIDYSNPNGFPDTGTYYFSRLTAADIQNNTISAQTYNANGALIRKMQYGNVGGVATLQYTTDYIDGFVYITAGTGTAALSYFPMPEGRVLYNSGTFTQEFIITDPQGNARVSFQNDAGAALVKQETSYYGFGYQMAGSLVALPSVPNKQLYNGGAEWQNDYSNMPDYYQTYNRNYDAALARFVGVDPQAEGAESMTSYQYAGNNPIMNNDPNGDKLVQQPVPMGPLGASAFGINNGQYIPPGDVVSSGFGLGSGGGGDYSGPLGGGIQPIQEWEDQEVAYNIAKSQYEYEHEGEGKQIYNAGDGTASDPHTGIATSALASNISYYEQHGITDDVAGTVHLKEINITDWSQALSAIQAEAYASQGGAWERLVLPASAWNTQLPDMTGCFRGCQIMTGTQPPLNHAILINKTHPNALIALKALGDLLESGQPVIVGVDYKPGSPNADGVTDHFVVIAGYGVDGNGETYLRFYDPGTAYFANGTSPNNRFYMNDDGLLIGHTAYAPGRVYIVSQVRLQ